MVAPALRSAKIASETVNLSLRAIEQADLGSWTERVGRGLSFRLNTTETTDQLRGAYRSWLLGQGFQELAKGVRQALEEAFLFVSALELPAQVATIEELENRLRFIRRSAGRKKFPQLVEHVSSRLAEPLHFEAKFLSMQRIRNCLEHRAGVVGEDDLDKGQREARLSLPRLKLFFKNGDAEVELQQGQRFERETMIYVRHDVRIRTFQLGDRISFYPEEFSEIALPVGISHRI